VAVCLLLNERQAHTTPACIRGTGFPDFSSGAVSGLQVDFQGFKYAKTLAEIVMKDTAENNTLPLYTQNLVPHSKQIK